MCWFLPTEKACKAFIDVGWERGRQRVADKRGWMMQDELMMGLKKRWGKNLFDVRPCPSVKKGGDHKEVR